MAPRNRDHTARRRSFAADGQRCRFRQRVYRRIESEDKATPSPDKARKPLTAKAADQPVANGDGLTIAALAERAGAGREQVLALLCELEQAQRVRRIGQPEPPAGVPVPGEDRIRKRGAQLASRSRRTRA